MKKIWFLLPLIWLLVSFPPISTSMYLPAIPDLQVLWGVPLKTINLTLIFFYLGLNAFAMALGSFGSMHMSKIFNDITMVKLGFYGMLVGGAILYLIPHSHPVIITLPMLFISICLGLIRPFSINMVLESVDKHTGTASSLIMFAYPLLGSTATWLVSLEWADKISVIGFLAAFANLIILVVLNLMFNKTPDISCQ